jgi:hypothetical protein
VLSESRVADLNEFTIDVTGARLAMTSPTDSIQPLAEENRHKENKILTFSVSF